MAEIDHPLLDAAASPEFEGQTAKYFDKHEEQDGKFREGEPIAQLLRECERMTAG